MAVAINSRESAKKHKQEYDRAIADYTQAIRIDPKDANAYGNLAWLLSTCGTKGVRDGKKSIELATKACELSQWNNAECLESLAAAHAELGNFKEAVKCQKQAIKLGFDDDDHLKQTDSS